MAIFDDLSLLRSFVSIVESGSISAAARKLRLAQPTVSRHLKALERQCPAELLRRDTHSISLTDTGSKVLADARAMLLLAEESEQRLRDDRTALQGKIRLFSTLDFGQSVVSRLIAKFIQLHPEISFELAYSNRPVHMIGEGCDVGIIAGTLIDHSIVARLLGPIRRFPVASPDFLESRPTPTSLGDMLSWPWMALSGSQFGGAEEVALYAAGKSEQTLHIRPVMISEGVTSLREAALQGLGVVVLPEWLIREDVADNRLVRVLPMWRAKELEANIVYPVQGRLLLRVQTFIDFASTHMKALLR
jgi:DNA-binding transcriptional LysR family regulator